MKNMGKRIKNGYTLIELLVVISLLVVVTLSASIGINKMTKNNAQHEYEKQIEKIKIAAKIYVHEQPYYKSIVYNDDNTTNGQCIYLKNLIDYNLIKENILNPKNNSAFDEYSKVRVKYNSATGTLTYDFLESETECISDIVNINFDEPTNLSDKLSDTIIRDNRAGGKTIQTVKDDTMFFSVSNASQTGLWLENRTGKTENNLPVYFFRGAVQNNYVSFAGKMWRIVRINEDGTIKLILGGNTTTDGYGGTTTTYNPNFNAATYVDYSLSTNTLKTANETWYSSNIGNNSAYSGKIALTKFCNDKTNDGGSTTIFYGAFTRLDSDNTPQYKCPNSSDNLVYNIGALTADEVVYAGGKYGTNNSTYYLYDNATEVYFWWLLSPQFFTSASASVFSVSGSANPGMPNGASVTNPQKFRPVISLKADTKVLGKGTKDSPYVVQ